MPMRSTLADAARRAQTTISRATIREIDDDHLCQEVKHADVFHSETPSSFEMWHPLGSTSVAMPQAQDDQQQQGQDQGGDGGGGDSGGDNQWNQKQPRGEAAEAMMLYVNGQRSHPVAMVNDRRVRPYGLKPGEGANYSPEGSGQMLYHRVREDGMDGLYLLTCDDSGGGRRADGKAQQSNNRFVSIRHVNKKKQRRKKQQQQQGGSLADGGSDGGGGGQQGGRLPDDSKSNYKHEGDSVNTETRHYAGSINHYDGAKEVGNYKRANKEWCHHTGDRGQSTRADQNHSHIKYGGAHCWMEGGCFHSVPWVLKPDPCT